MDVLILLGRLLFGALFLAAALGHLTQTNVMARYAEARGIRYADQLTQISGVAIALGGLSVILGVYADIGTLVLIVFLLSVAFGVHRFWAEPEGDERMTVQTQFMKDLALAGAALVMLGMLIGADDAMRFAMTDTLL